MYHIHQKKKKNYRQPFAIFLVILFKNGYSTPMSMKKESIQNIHLQNVRVHNLKSVSVALEPNRLICFTYKPNLIAQAERKFSLAC